MDNINYRLSAKEWALCLFGYMGIISILSFLFYDSVWGFISLLPFLFFYIGHTKKASVSKHQEQLNREFLKALQSLSSSLAAGFSPENALFETAIDMEKLYGRKSVIYRELTQINNQIANGTRCEDALISFARRTGNEAIRDFAMIFSIANISGEDFVKVITSCTEIIQSSNAIKEEAKVLIRGKQYEQKIMNVIPLGIIAYLRISSGSFINVLYHNVLGVLVMSLCLALYVLSIYIAERISKIEV